MLGHASHASHVAWLHNLVVWCQATLVFPYTRAWLCLAIMRPIVCDCLAGAWACGYARVGVSPSSQSGWRDDTPTHAYSFPPGGKEQYKYSGSVLLSHTIPRAVPSALEGLTTGFGMGPGVSLPLWPPENLIKPYH